MNIYICFYFDTARDVVPVLLIFVYIYHFTYTFSKAHTDCSSPCQIGPVRDSLHGKTGLGGSTPRNGPAGKTLEILILNDKAISHLNFKLAAPEGIFRPLLWWLSKSGGIWV